MSPAGAAKRRICDRGHTFRPGQPGGTTPRRRRQAAPTPPHRKPGVSCDRCHNYGPAELRQVRAARSAGGDLQSAHPSGGRNALWLARWLPPPHLAASGSANQAFRAIGVTISRPADFIRICRIDKTAIGVTKLRPRAHRRGESAIGVTLLRPPVKRQICDRGHTFEAAKTAIGVTLLNGFTPADPHRSRICDRGHTFECWRGGEEANLRQGSHF